MLTYLPLFPFWLPTDNNVQHHYYTLAVMWTLSTVGGHFSRVPQGAMLKMIWIKYVAFWMLMEDNTEGRAFGENAEEKSRKKRSAQLSDYASRLLVFSHLSLKSPASPQHLPHSTNLSALSISKRDHKYSSHTLLGALLMRWCAVWGPEMGFVIANQLFNSGFVKLEDFWEVLLMG